MGFDKYKYYLESVQSPDTDVEFFDRIYRETFGKEAQTLREDFCGTFSVCCEWSKLGSERAAIGVDLDEEPIQYGYDNYFSQLTEDQKNRIQILQKNVLDPELPKSDIVAALNFSYFLFKRREDLKSYFKNVYDKLNNDGLFVIDCFGGPATQEPNVEETEHDDFSYFWDQDYYNPISNHAKFYIHFQSKGGKKVERAFSYDWRMWSLTELQELFEDVGFKDVHVMWEGDDEDGEGNGEFTRTTEGEDCEAWVAYVVGKKVSD